MAIATFPPYIAIIWSKTLNIGQPHLRARNE